MFNRSKVDILRFAMSYSCCLISDPGSARLAKETTDSPTGPGRAFFKAEPATNQCIAAAEVMLKDGHKGTNRLSTIACRPGLPLSDAPPADPKFPAQCIAPQRNRTLKARATGQAVCMLKRPIANRPELRRFQLSVQSNIRVIQLRHWTPNLSVIHSLVKRLLSRPRHLGAQLKMALRNREPSVLLIQSDRT